MTCCLQVRVRERARFEAPEALTGCRVGGASRGCRCRCTGQQRVRRLRLTGGLFHLLVGSYYNPPFDGDDIVIHQMPTPYS